MATEAGGKPATGTGGIATENIVYIRKRTEDPAGYDVFGLEETAATTITTTDGNETSQPAGFKLLQEQHAEVPQPWLESFLVEGIPGHLRSESRGRKVHVLESTRSGTGRALDFNKAILEKLLHELGLRKSVKFGDNREASYEGPDRSFYHGESTHQADSISEYGRNLSAETDHTVIMLSGDGGVVEMLNAIKPRLANVPPPLLAILPLGTGNALFNSLNKAAYQQEGDGKPPSPLVQGLRALFRGRRAPLPSFRAEFAPTARLIQGAEYADNVERQYGAIVASYGFHSQLVWESDTPEYRKHGDKRFGMVAQELLKEAHGYRAKVEIMQRAVSQSDSSSPIVVGREQHAYVLATMVSNLEKTFTISPQSTPLDNKLRLVHFGSTTGQKIMDVMMQAYNEGKHVGMQWSEEDGTENAVGYDEIGAVKVTTAETDPRWRKVCIDGTIVELPEGGSMTVATEETPRLRILVDRSINL